MSTLNFDEFASASLQDWQQLVAKELGDRSMESLIWSADGGIDMEPYALNSDESYAMELPVQWEKVQRIAAEDAKQWNSQALEALMGGCNSLSMGESPSTNSQFRAMLDGVFLQYIHLHIEQSSNWLETAKCVVGWCHAHELNSKELRGSFGVDGLRLSDEEFKPWVIYMKTNFALYRGFTVDTRRIHEHGGSTIQEIAFALTEGHAILTRCLDAGLSVDDASALIQFNFSTGSSYFAEIAKYRAFRWAWKSIIEQYQPQYACSAQTHIQASTSRFTQTAKDSPNNLLRATTQAMSAAVGGVNGLLVVPYNSWNSTTDESAQRWSRNIQQLLTEESYFEHYRSAANGAHYVESFTAKLVQAGWAIFQQWDALLASQGYDAFVKLLNEAIETHRKQLEVEVQEGKRIVVGVNKYVNRADASVVGAHVKTLTALLENS